MAYAPARANLVQLGRSGTTLSATATPVAATTKWRGEGATDIVDARKLVRVAENIGLAGNTDRLYTASELARLAMASTPLTYEECPHIFEASIKAATPGAGPGFIRVYDYPQGNTPNAIEYYSIEAGNAVVDEDAHVMPGSFVEDFELSGEAGPDGSAWRIAANWVGQRKIPQAFTPALTAPSVEEALFNNTKIWIDDSGGTIGTTLLSNVLVSATITCKTGWVAVPTADGALYHTNVKQTIPDDQVRYEITFELENDTNAVVTERAAYVAGDLRLIRMDCPGSGPTKNLRIDICGRHDEFSTYENTNGNVTVTIRGYGVISPADSEYCTIEVTNGVATLP